MQAAPPERRNCVSLSPSGFSPEERLNRSELRTLLIWIGVGLLGTLIAFRYFFVAFPEAAVDFRISRGAAVEEAKRFLSAQGFQLEGYQNSIVFRVDDNAKNYLEREAELEEANRLMSSEVDIWYWSVRFFRPLQKEEFSVRVSTAGKVVGMERVVEEARAGAQLDQAAARARAESFLRRQLGLAYDAYDFLPEEANSMERPHRRDWSFTWERLGFRAPKRPDGATYRLRVGVQGDGIGEYESFLKVPEAWERDFRRLRSSNELWQWVGQVPYFFLLGAGLLVVFEFARRGLVHWQAALKVGLALAVLYLVMIFNQWPLTRANYDTNTSYSGFFAQQMGIGLLLSVLTGLMVALFYAAGEPFYRQTYPDKLRLGAGWSLRGLRSKEFFRSCVIGLAMAAAHIGFVVAFYLLGRKLGIWAPQEIKYSDTVSTALPWIYPLAISIYAATNEEFTFRLFAIPLLMRYTKSRVLAVVLPAFVWGFLHSVYPQQPGYVRGLEVGVIGVVAGWVMIRWGILATLVWHYTVDALLIGLILLRSESLSFKISGAIVAGLAVLPLVVAGTSYLIRRRFEPIEDQLNRAEVLEEKAPAAKRIEAQAAGWEPMSRRTMRILVGCAVLGIAIAAAGRTESIGKYIRFQTNPRQAAACADEILRERKVDPGTYRRTVTTAFTFNSLANEFLKQQIGVAAANKLYQEQVPSAFWRVRYFRSLQKEEYAVILKPDGALHSIHHVLDEKTAGANLTKEEAQERAEAWLRESKQVDLSKWKLVSATSEKRPARTDHVFTWEEIAAIGTSSSAENAAHVRMELQVLGDEVSRYRIFVKIPEEWERRQKAESFGAIAQQIWKFGFFVALAILLLVLFFRNIRQPEAASIPWKRMAKWAVWGLLAMLVLFANSVPRILEQYDTQLPFSTFGVVLVLGLVIVAAAVYSGLFFLFGLSWFFLTRAFGSEGLPGWRGMPATYYRDAALIAVAGPCALVGLAGVSSVIARYWPAGERSLSADVPGLLDLILPGVVEAAGSVQGGLFMAGLVALVAGFVGAYVRKVWMKVGLVVLAAMALADNWIGWGAFLQEVAVLSLSLGVIGWGVARIARFNLLGYFLATALLSLGGSAVELSRQPNAFFKWNGYFALVFGMALLAWPVVTWLRGRSALPPVSEPPLPAGVVQ